MSTRSVAGPSPSKEIGAKSFEPHVFSSVLFGIRMALRSFTHWVLPFIAVTSIVLLASPFVGKVFNDQPSSDNSASQVDEAENNLGNSAAANSPPKVVVPEKTKFKTSFTEGTIMAASRAIHEDTANMRSQLNTPIPTALDPTSYPSLNRALYDYEQAFVFSGNFNFNKSKIIAILVALTLVVVLPWIMFASKLFSRRRALRMVMLASMAIVVAAQPLQIMTVVQATKASVVNAGFLGDNFEKLQYNSQQELVNKPAAQAALGVDGQTAAGMAYVAALQNGEPVTNQEIAQFKNSNANPVKATAVAAFSLIQAVAYADIQRPFIWLAVALETIINVVLNPFTLVVFLMILMSDRVRTFLRRHLIGFIITVAGLYIGLLFSVLMVTGPAQASLLASHLINSTDTGPLTAVLGGVFALGLFWFFQKLIFAVAKRSRRAIAITRGRKRESLDHNTGDVVSGKVIDQRRLARVRG